ncbi:hypothetical protein [Nitrosomonas sp.]|uniref:hypothetical protein n=1 Tax=Nitrosomonas sp. TaxID=42353 RepID=UPI001D2C06F0|nr:hypothetical protein [Nitrosomonas sp.]MBX3617434.1 hypothetical protein [Nitrosomonas sp.]
MKLLSWFFLNLFVFSSVTGCVSPIALNRAIEVYDNAAIHAESRQLLTNIARAQHHEPLHFTRVSSIAATFNFSANAGATPALTGESGGLLAPVFGASVAENPTFSIDPIAGDEFTKRILTPFSQHKLTLLLRQHFNIDLLLRMMAQEVQLHQIESHAMTGDTLPEKQKRKHRSHHGPKASTGFMVMDSNEQTGNKQFLPGIQLTKEQEHRLRSRQHIHQKQTVYHNNPSDRSDYEMFRRIVLHLAAIQNQKQLYAEPLTFERNWTIPSNVISPEGLFQAIEKDFTVSHDEQRNTYTLSKQLPGPILITNYDPSILCCEERVALYDLINPWIENDVAFDIRPGYPGGEWPIRGAFRLRSFHTILNFLGHSLGEQAEYFVDKDPRTPPLIKNVNPSHTLGLIVDDQLHHDTKLYAHSHGKYYAVDTTGENAHWNRNAFQLLYILFRLTVTDAKSLGLPITISK